MKQTGKPENQPLSPKDWLWVALACLCTLLVCLGVRWLATQTGASDDLTPSAPSPALIASETPPSVSEDSEQTFAPNTMPPTPDESPAVVEHTIPHDEAVRMTGEALRRHSKEDPNAPDALSEERIKAIVEQGALVN